MAPRKPARKPAQTGGLFPPHKVPPQAPHASDVCGCGAYGAFFSIGGVWMCRGCWAAHPDNGAWRAEQAARVREISTEGL
jgi:hypothetical protein